MRGLIQAFNLWDNPVFNRFRRSELRLKKSLFWLLTTLIMTTFVVSLGYILQTNSIDMNEPNAALELQNAARNLWLPLLIIQGLILLLKGTGNTSAGLIQDKIDQTLDYQRLTPVSPLRNIVGYLFGLPLLEYTMFALTLPHLAFIVIRGNIPLSTIGSVYLALFVCAVFYHMTAIAVGMVMKRWIFGYLLSIFSVAFLNLILAPLGSQLGLKFMQFLSVFPVIGQKVVPLMTAWRLPPPGFQPRPDFQPPADFQPTPLPLPAPLNEGPIFSFADPVPFFNWTLSPFLFTLILQAGLIVTFATMAVRRWEKADKHSLSKLYALGVLAAFIFLVVGNLWPIITGQYLPFSILGNNNLDQLSDYIAIGLPLVYSLAVVMLCAFLFANSIPAHHAYLRGVRRARKLERKAALPWDDDSASISFMSLFVLLTLIGFWILDREMTAAGFTDFLAGTDYAHWRLPLVLGLVLFSMLLNLQVIEQRGAVLSILLIWMLPILTAIVATAAMEDLTRLQTILASLSPLATLLMAGLSPLQSTVPVDAPNEFAVINSGVQTGIAFLIAQIALLAIRWRYLRTTLQ